MIAPEIEKKRLEVLARFQIMDTPAEAEFDDFTWLASSICGASMSTITFVDSTRQWFKSRVGVEASEGPRQHAFCQHALYDEKILEIPDAHKDMRFAENPLVTSSPNIRFYAGVPLRTQGLGMGTLCVMDRQARQLSDFQRECLNRLGRQVVNLMELRISRLELQAHTNQLQEAEDRYRDVVENATDLIFTTNPVGEILFVNEAWKKSLGFPIEAVRGQSLLTFLTPEDRDSIGEVLGHLLDGESVGSLELSFVKKDGSVLHTLGKASCRFSDDKKPMLIRGIFRDVTQERIQEISRQELVGRLQQALSAVSLCLSQTVKGK